MQVIEIVDKMGKLVEALDDMKARDIEIIDTSVQSVLFDRMIIASGNSSRHNRAICRAVEKTASQLGIRKIGLEGMATAEWVLVDLGDIIVHIMQPETRRHYDLKKLWILTPDKKDAGE